MYTKYEIKSYPNNNSDVEQNKNYFQYKIKDFSNSENSDNILETTFQPKCIFTKQNDNISFYQSTSKCDFKNSKKREENKTQNITPIMKEKNKIYTIQNTNERKDQNEIQNFSYNYSDIGETKNKNRNRTIKNNINNINININPNTNNYNFNTNSECNNEKETRRINLNEHIIKKHKRKRITKSCKRQFNVQKRDNFNVLSYKQPEYDSDMNNTNINKNKIIQIYKKQGVEEIFFPSKRTHSPNIPSKRKDIVEKYQSHTLKYQSFFGSFNSSNQSKMVKSYSRTKINQLNDFNIDKLIEIGDKYANMMKPPLPLGKILNNSIINFNSKIKKNKYQIPINTNNNCFNFSKYSKRTYNKQLEDNKENIPLFITDKNRVTKKLISKNNIKNQKLSINKENEVENQKYPNENTVRKILNFKNENKKINDISINPNINSSVVLRRRNNNNNGLLRKQNSFDKNVINDLGEEIPKRKVQKIVGDLRINTNNNIKPKYIILNKSRGERENKKEKIMTETVNNYRNCRNNEEKKGLNNNRKILIDINVSKKYNRYRDNKRQNKQNSYYGYDDRHNLEDTINNHSYYESLHSNKNLNNNIYEKVV